MSTYRQSFHGTGQGAKPPSPDNGLQQHRSQAGFVEESKLTLAGFPVDKSDITARGAHLPDYSIAAIDRSSPELRHFAELPHFYTLNPLAPPVADVILQLGDDSMFYRHGEARLFGCYRQGILVGRAAASVDHRFPDPDVGHFGYFETCADRACAALLMQACEAWLREQGKKRIEGPLNLNMLAGYRVQTAGFETTPFPGEPRNPAYYAELLAALGYREVALWQSWDISSFALRALRGIDWLQRLRRPGVDPDYRTEELRTDRLEEETRKIHALVHEIFTDNYGFSPIDLAEHVQMQGAALHDSANLCGAFLYHATQPAPVGFSFGFHMGRVAILHTFGVTRAQRGTGAANLLFSQGLQQVWRQGARRAIGALAKQGKSKYERLGRPARAYAVFGKDL